MISSNDHDNVNNSGGKSDVNYEMEFILVVYCRAQHFYISKFHDNYNVNI
jgi:hypothetical protein